MASRLAGKTILLTAAAQGIGRTSALAFAGEGAQVTATDVNEEKLAKLAGAAGIETRCHDVTDLAAIEAIAGEVGPPDVLFNCAGFVHHGSVLTTGEDEWRASMTLDVDSMYRMIRAFLPGMIERGGGSIINMSSVAADCIRVGVRRIRICSGTVEALSRGPYRRLRRPGPGAQGLHRPPAARAARDGGDLLDRGLARERRIHLRHQRRLRAGWRRLVLTARGARTPPPARRARDRRRAGSRSEG